MYYTYLYLLECHINHYNSKITFKYNFRYLQVCSEYKTVIFMNKYIELTFF